MAGQECSTVEFKVTTFELGKTSALDFCQKLAGFNVIC